MPRKKTTTATSGSTTNTDALLALLSPARQAEIVEEAVGAYLRFLVGRASNLGALVEGLQGHDHWGHLQKLSVASLLQIGATKGAAHAAPAAHAVSAPAPAAKVRAQPAASPATKAKPAPKGKAKKFVRRTSEQIEAIVKKVVGFIEQHPGSRAEQILKQVGGDKGGIKDALSRLREEKKVKTAGIKRAMTYQMA